VVWFEIPAADFDRAVRFYETLLDMKMKVGEWPTRMAVFPYEEPAVSGCVMDGPAMTPAPGGVVVYLNASPSLDAVVARAKAAGGEVVHPRTEVPGIGVYAKIRDTEGNIVGLHALA
jgi:predicted enzyme related to lactoylglutathione lyase